jgi:hypothetical protein
MKYKTIFTIGRDLVKGFCSCPSQIKMTRTKIANKWFDSTTLTQLSWIAWPTATFGNSFGYT